LVYSKYCSIAVAIFLLTISSSIAVQAQRTIGVDWQMPENPQQAVQQLEKFDSLGISIIKLTPPLPPDVWNMINKLNLSVYGDLNITYPISQTFANPDSAFINAIRTQSSAFLRQESVEAIGLFSYGAIQQKQFGTTMKPFIQELKSSGIDSIYATLSTFQAVPKEISSIDFFVKDISVSPKNISDLSVADNVKIGAYQYHPSASLQKYITPFKRFLDVTATNPQKPLFINGKWLLSTIEMHPSFTTTIQSLTSEADPIFVTPQESLPNSQQSPIPIILLLMVWASVAWHYNSSPLYRKSLFRYFSAHKFFIDDIFQRHIRSASPATILIVQNTALVAAALFAYISSTVNPLGLEALFHHLPVLGIFGESISSLTLGIALLSLLLAFLSTIWLYISHKKITSLTQIATIYAWPLHLNLIAATVLIVIFASGGPTWLLSLTGMIVLLVQLLSFVVASFDTARFVPSHTLLYLLVTSGLYLIMIVGGLIWGMISPELRDIIALAISL